MTKTKTPKEEYNLSAGSAHQLSDGKRDSDTNPLRMAAISLFLGGMAGLGVVGCLYILTLLFR